MQARKLVVGGMAFAVAVMTNPGWVAAVPVTCTGACAPVVTADVAATLSFNATITELVPVVGGPIGATTIGPVVTDMVFGSLASQGTFDPDGAGPLPPQPRSMSSTRAYQVFFGVNAQQRPFHIFEQASPLQTPAGDTIPNGAFIVTPLDGVGGDPTLPFGTNPTGNTTVRSFVGGRSAVSIAPQELFHSTGGPTNTMAATIGITDDPTLGATEFIPLDQAAGAYTTTATFTATVD